MVNTLPAAYKILVNGKDVTAKIKPHLISLRITDNQQDQVDTLEMVVNATFKRPDFGDEMKVYLGWGEADAFVGLFFMQSSTITNNKQMTLQATGVDFSKSLKERRNQNYEMGLDKVTATIADKQGLSLKTDIQQGTRFEQKNESDMAFLNRLAKEYNAIFNIKNNTLYMMKKGADVPKVSVDIKQCITSEITHTNTTFYQSCKAIYHNTKRNKMIEVVAGSGEPMLIKQGKWHNDEQAFDAAINALERANRGTAQGNVNIIGRVIFAGSELTIADATYQISTVTHTVAKSWKTELGFNRQ